MTNKGNIIFFIATLAAFNINALENSFDKSSVETPKGKFECTKENEKSGIYSLRLGGTVLFKGSFMAITESDGKLKNGIYSGNIGCPQIVSADKGYVVIVRDTQPPSFGVSGYAVINLNLKEPEYTELAEGQWPNDGAIKNQDRIVWKNNGLILNYIGYPIGQPGGDINSPKPRKHIVRYNFDSDDVTQEK